MYKQKTYLEVRYRGTVTKLDAKPATRVTFMIFCRLFDRFIIYSYGWPTRRRQQLCTLRCRSRFKGTWTFSCLEYILFNQWRTGFKVTILSGNFKI